MYIIVTSLFSMNTPTWEKNHMFLIPLAAEKLTGRNQHFPSTHSLPWKLQARANTTPTGQHPQNFPIIKNRGSELPFGGNPLNASNSASPQLWIGYQGYQALKVKYLIPALLRVSQK